MIPEKLYEMEVAHMGLTELYRVKTMHERKALMADLSDGFIALPGGIGTMEEIMEVMTWAQIGYHEKPCAFLNVNGYYDKLFQFFQTMQTQDFLYGTIEEHMIIAENIEALLNHIRGTAPFRILDFGCGPGRDLATFRSLGHEPVGLEGSP